ncbi:MAG: hypothetical protein ACI97A_000229 [Planctomycetota bacterium]|jgi:hypothetical protein
MKHILVTGPHRSGTTWIGNTIASHGGMRLLLEPFNSNFPPYGFGVHLTHPYTHFESSEQQEELRRAFDCVLAEGPGGYARGVCQATNAGWKTPLRFAWHYLQAVKSPRVLVKDPIALFSADWLHEQYDLAVICTMRSPWAFVASLKVAKWGFSFKNLAKQEELMAEFPSEMVTKMHHLIENSDDKIEKWSHLWNLLHHQILSYKERFPSWHFIRYEEVAAEPQKGFAGILNHLNLEMTPAVSKYIDDYTSTKNKTETNSTSYQPRDSKKILESWRERLTESEIAQVTEATADLASKLYPDIQVS